MLLYTDLTSLQLLLLGLVGGTAYGGLVALKHSRNEIQKRSLIKHVPHLPYLLAFYVILTTAIFVFEYGGMPDFFKIIVSAMISVEATLLIAGRRFIKLGSED